MARPWPERNSARCKAWLVELGIGNLDSSGRSQAIDGKLQSESRAGDDLIVAGTEADQGGFARPEGRILNSGLDGGVERGEGVDVVRPGHKQESGRRRP